MKPATTLEDLVGIEHCKLGFYQELQQKVEQLKASNQELEKKRREVQAVLDGITDMMAVLSKDLKVQRVNHVFHDWYPSHAFQRKSDWFLLDHHLFVTRQIIKVHFKCNLSSIYWK